MINFVRTGTFISRVKVFCSGAMLSIRLKLNALCVTAYIGCSVDYHKLLEYIKGTFFTAPRNDALLPHILLLFHLH